MVFLAWQFVFHENPPPVPQQTYTRPQEVVAHEPPVTEALPIPPIPPRAAAGASPKSDTRVAVSKFVEEWFKASNSRRGAQAAMRFYAPTVDYYQRGVVPKAYVESDKAQMLRRRGCRSAA